MLPLPLAPRWLAGAVAAAARGGVLTGAIWNAATRSHTPVVERSAVLSTPSPSDTSVPQVDGNTTGRPGTPAARPTGSPGASRPSASPTAAAPAPSATAVPSSAPSPEPSPQPSPEPSAPARQTTAPVEQPPSGGTG